MAFLNLTTLFPFLLIYAFFLVASPAHCSEIEEKILQEINGFRNRNGLKNLSTNTNAECFADKVAGSLKDEPCSRPYDFLNQPGMVPKLPEYKKLLDECNTNINTTRAAMMLPTCVPKMNETLLVEDFTQSNYNTTLQNPNYTQIGVGSKDQWMVVVVTTYGKTGNFSNESAPPSSLLGLLHCFIGSFFGFIFITLL